MLKFYLFLGRGCVICLQVQTEKGTQVPKGQALAVGRLRTFNPPKGVFWSLYNWISPVPPENRSSRYVAEQQSVVCGAWDEYKLFTVFASWILKPLSSGSRVFSLCSISSMLRLCSVKWC